MSKDFCRHAGRQRHGVCGDPAMGPAQVSYMAGLLAKHTMMAVTPAEDGVEVRANSVYTIPPNTSLFIKEGKLHLTDPIKRDGIRTPIDFFFRSLAQTNTKGDLRPAIRQRLGRNPRNKGDPWRRRYCRRGVLDDDNTACAMDLPYS